MAGADQPVGSPSPPVTRGDDPARPRRLFRRRAAAGTWVVFLIYALVMLLWLALAAETAYQRQWASFAGYTVLALILVLPAGVLKRPGRAPKGRKPPAPPPSSGGAGIIQMLGMLDGSGYEKAGAGSASAT